VAKSRTFLTDGTTFTKAGAAEVDDAGAIGPLVWRVTRCSETAAERFNGGDSLEAELSEFSSEQLLERLSPIDSSDEISIGLLELLSLSLSTSS